MEDKGGLVNFARAKSVPVETILINLGITGKLTKKQSKGKDEWSGFCPFGDHGKQGVFSINDESGAFICHACKRKGGNVLEFVKQYMDTIRISLKPQGSKPPANGL